MARANRELPGNGRCGPWVALGLPAVTAIVFPILAAFQSSSPQPTPGTVIQAHVREVSVPVVVTDKRGHYVTDLKSSEFQVFEDGKAQKIVAFSKTTEPAALAAVAAAALPEARSKTNRPKEPTRGLKSADPRRTYLVCIDTLHSSFANFGRAREALERFFEQETNGDSQYALITLGREIHVVQDSTRDPELILEALRNKQFLKLIQDSEAANLSMETQQFVYQMRDDYCKFCACYGAVGDLPGCVAAKGRITLTLLSAGERTSSLTQNFLRGLEELVKATSAMPANGTVIFLSDGFNRNPGRELYAIMEGFQPRDHSLEFNPRDTQPLLQGILKLAVRYDVKFYTIDSRGLYAAASVPGNSFDASFSGAVPEQVDSNTVSAARENTDALFELAHETGGLFFENSNDLLKGVKRAFADGREYYVLAYVPSNHAIDGTYRKIHVEVTRRSTEVRSKTGYWATE